jgi:hypothetical protein
MLLVPALAAAPASPPDADFALQGEYAAPGWGAQIVAQGDGAFLGVLFTGGLPGAGAEKNSRATAEAKREAGGPLAFAWPGDRRGSLQDGVLTLSSAAGEHKLARVERSSPTMGAPPPPGAVVLFDGSSADAFKPGRLEDGLLCEGANSVRTFQDHRLHLEFRLPYQPKARGQGRGNSGCYLQGRYEVQILDSFGLPGRQNECGGIYSLRDPDQNLCFPPLSWQTYDIDFTAARFDAQGRKTADARVTVRHNGVVIHDNVALTKGTTAAPVKEGPQPSYLHLQNHGNPVRFRNIWVVEP